MYTITSIIQTSNHSIAYTTQLHIYMARFPLLFLSPCWLPFVPPLCPLLVSGGEYGTSGVYDANLQYSYNRYISIWITLIVSQPPLSHTSRKPDAQSPTVLSRIKINYC